MNNFILKADKLNVTYIKNEIEDNENLFNSVPLRTNYKDSPHREVDDILLRGPFIGEGSDLTYLQNDIQCYTYKAFQYFPETYKAVLDINRFVEGEQIGRVIVTRLKPGASITPHIDEGDAAEMYDRYHLVIQSDEGSEFHIEDQMVNMKEGQLYWVDNNKKHWVNNNGTVDRIHLIVDIMKIVV